MMKTSLLSCVAALTLASAAQAQFTYTAGDGTVLASTQKPTGVAYWTEDGQVKKAASGKPMRQSEHYLHWATDHLRVDVAFYNDEKVTSAARYFVYFEDIDAATAIPAGLTEYKDQPQLNTTSATIEPARGNVLMHDYNGERLESLTMPSMAIEFGTPEAFKSFDQKLREAAGKLLAQPGRKPSERPRWATFTREFAGSGGSAAPKVRSSISVVLANKSKYDVKLTILDSPKATSSSDRLLAPGQTARIQAKVGGQIRTRDGVVLLTFTAAMHDTEVIVAK